MNAGGACIGCTMPGFPDKITPFYKRPPGSLLSTTGSRLLATTIRPLRMFTNEYLNREARWDLQEEIPSGWARERRIPSGLSKTGHRFYDVFRRSTDTAKVPGEAWGKQPVAKGGS